jgi:signal transduction histidine kinase
MVQQAVANLLDNALKFSPSGGVVRLSAATIDRQVRLTVADQGPGIPEADRDRATERFFRGEAARHTPGFGLGLALVQAVALLHDGALILDDANPGLRATITLAAAVPGRAAPRMNAGSSAPHATESAPMLARG